MYCGVPATTPLWVRLASSAARARPKSVSLTRSMPFSSRMLAGLTSRWTSPWAWAAARPAAVCMPIRRISGSSSGPVPVEPVLERAAGHVLHDEVGQPGRLVDGVDGDDVLVDDRRRRPGLAERTAAAPPRWWPAAGDSTLIATLRCSAGSNALSTTPMPPRPTTPVTSYGANRSRSAVQSGPPEQGLLGVAVGQASGSGRRWSGSSALPWRSARRLPGWDAAPARRVPGSARGRSPAPRRSSACWQPGRYRGGWSTPAARRRRAGRRADPATGRRSGQRSRVNMGSISEECGRLNVFGIKGDCSALPNRPPGWHALRSTSGRATHSVEQLNLLPQPGKHPALGDVDRADRDAHSAGHLRGWPVLNRRRRRTLARSCPGSRSPTCSAAQSNRRCSYSRSQRAVSSGAGCSSRTSEVPGAPSRCQRRSRRREKRTLLSDREQPGPERAALGIVVQSPRRPADGLQDVLRQVRGVRILQPMPAGQAIDQRRVDIDKLTPGVAVVDVANA